MKAIILFSSGIDSPVAAQMCNRKNIELVGLNFYFNKLDKEYKQKLIELGKITGLKKIYFANLFVNNREFSEKCNKRYQCIFCKRTMLRIADLLCKKLGANFIITGDNIGQVATQTIPNMKIVSSVTKFSIIRPVLCYNKNDIINIAKIIGTYNINLDFKGSCPFLPKNPATKCDEHKIEKEESLIDIEILKKDIMSSIKVFR